MAYFPAVVGEGGIGWGFGYCTSALIWKCTVLFTNYEQVKEELNNDPAFFGDFSVNRPPVAA